MKLSHSDGIVLALARHAKLNTTQMATKISHDHDKTRHLLVYMARNGKIAVCADTLNGERAYELTAEGHKIALKLRPETADIAPYSHAHAVRAPQTATSKPASGLKTQLPQATPPPPPPQRPVPPTVTIKHDRNATEVKLAPKPKFGLLNTGELIILLPEHDELGRQYTTTLSAIDTDVLRQTLRVTS